MRSITFPPHGGVDASSRASRLVGHVALAAAGVLVFQTLVMTSGRVVAGDGLGWDGRGYASLMTDGLDRGSDVTRSRPLLPLATRLPHALGLDVIQSFQLMNYVYAFALYFFVALILDRYGAGARAKAIVIVNLALCIATSKMFAYYPVQVDLGALALITAAFHFVMTDRPRVAGAVCVLAFGAREFAVAVVLCGLHRAFRRGRLWPDGVWYVPGVAAGILVRVSTFSDGSISASDAVANLAFWRSPAFVTAFAYYSITVFGGLSALLAVHPRWCLARLRREPELVTFLIVIAGLAAVGNLDIWRYLVFGLPVCVVLIAAYWRDRLVNPAVERLCAAALLFGTVLTQRPLERMDQTRYFQDWFPLYDIIGRIPSPDMLALWGTRLAALVLVLATFISIRRSHRERHEPAT